MDPIPGIRIPAEQLSPETLENLLEEFVTRDGTELTDARQKIAQVRAQLDDGRAEIWFDPQTRTCNIVLAGTHPGS